MKHASQFGISEQLIEKLRTGTETLKDQYFEKTGQYALTSFEAKQKRYARPKEEWENEYKVKTKPSKDYKGETYLSYVYDRNYYKMYDAKDRLRKEIARGYEAYRAKLMKNAADHYEDSLLKLAFRIQDKGLKQESIKVESGHVGVNIETTITDGTNTVRAWTIVAQGEIQRPHYRYLIK